LSTEGNLSTSDLAGTEGAQSTTDGDARLPAGEAAARDSATAEASPSADAAQDTTTEGSAQTAGTAEVASQTDQASNAPLFADSESAGFRQRWQDIQTGFVDEPRQAVERADALVAELMRQLAQSFAQERANLEAQWGQGESAGTEELRVALQRYRSFFERLLST